MEFVNDLWHGAWTEGSDPYIRGCRVKKERRTFPDPCLKRSGPAQVMPNLNEYSIFALRQYPSSANSEDLERNLSYPLDLPSSPLSINKYSEVESNSSRVMIVSEFL